MKYFME